MKRSEPLTVGEIIQKAMAQAGCTDTYRQQQACFLWAEVVGNVVNQHTIRRSVNHDELHVWINSGPLKNELRYISQQIIDTINRNIGVQVISKLIIH